MQNFLRRFTEGEQSKALQSLWRSNLRFVTEGEQSFALQSHAEQIEDLYLIRGTNLHGHALHRFADTEGDAKLLCKSLICSPLVKRTIARAARIQIEDL